MKKRFIALALIFVLALSFVSCNTTPGQQSAGETSDKIVAMYKRSTPTKSVTTITYEFYDEILIDTVTIVSGKVDGTLDAATYKQVKQRLRSVSSGSNASILDNVETQTFEKEYLQGMGVRVKGGGWDPTASSFAPEDGSLGLNVTDSLITDIKEDGKTISFTVAKANTKTVFGKEIGADVAVVIKSDGAKIVGISLTYTEPAIALDDPLNDPELPNPELPDTKISIEVAYSYDIEKISIGVR